MNLPRMRPLLFPWYWRDRRLSLEAGQLLVLQASQRLVQREVSVRDDSSIARVVAMRVEVAQVLRRQVWNAQGFAAVAVGIGVTWQ